MSKLNYQEIMEVRNQTNAFARSIGLALTFLEEGHAVTEMTITKDQLNPIGSVHGGCLYTAADVAAGGAAISYGDVVTTVDSSFRYLRPGLKTTRIKADANAIKHGKRLTVVQVNIYDQDETLLCIGTFSFMSVDG